jgi:hypothetical protein
MVGIGARFPACCAARIDVDVDVDNPSVERDKNGKAERTGTMSRTARRAYENNDLGRERTGEEMRKCLGAWEYRRQM